MVLEGPTPGLYEHDDEESWQPFRPFTARLNWDTRDPNLRFVDPDLRTMRSEPKGGDLLHSKE